VELTRACLARLEATEPAVRAYISVSGDAALEAAAAVDAARARGEALGPLAGVPLAVKDNLCATGGPTTAGSRILSSYEPPYDATAVARLRQAGAVVVGKTNMDEFGMGSTTEGSAFHATANPFDATRVPGGSSGGSAASVAARSCAGALGSDTGGSIRQPASFCGVVGVKPTYGRVSRHGLVAYASSLDTVGPIAQTVRDAALLLGAVAGADPMDATCSAAPVPAYAAALQPAEAMGSQPLAGLTLGLLDASDGPGVSPGVAAAVAAAAAHLESLGAAVERVSLPSFELGLPAYYVLAPCEASSNLSRYDGVRYGARAEDADDLGSMYRSTRQRGLGAEVKRRILVGTYALSAGYYDAYYKRAQQVRTLVKQELGGALGKCDALLLPAAPTAAYGMGDKDGDPLAMYTGDLFTVNVNLAGLPAVSVPCGEDGGMPVGLQLVGREMGEEALLRLAHAYEQTASAAPPLPQL